MKPTILKQNIRLGYGWKVLDHKLFALEPDNDFPKQEVAKYFVENLFRSTNGTFTIDMGFYGTYHQDRAGTYALYLIRGDFDSGEVLEKIKTRSQKDAVIKLEEYMQSANKGDFSSGVGKFIHQMKSLPVAQKIFNLF